MGALLALDLNVDAGVDQAVLVTLLGQNGAQIALQGVTAAELALSLTSLDSQPLAEVTTTPSSSGSLTFGVAPPAPTGANVASVAQLEAQGLPLTLSTSSSVPVVATVANVAALETLATAGLTVGQIAILASGGAGAFYQWSPADPGTPNGTTIIASSESPAGNWLLAGTVAIVLTAATAALFAGFASGIWDLVLTWADGTHTKLLGGRVFVTQTEATNG